MARRVNPDLMKTRQDDSSGIDLGDVDEDATVELKRGDLERGDDSGGAETAAIALDYADDVSLVAEFQRASADLPPHRVGRVVRHTRETQIEAVVDLDGVGNTQVDCPIGFFGHMLEALGRHAHLDLTLSVRGDLHVDQHHTVEDTAIVLGEAIRKALGDRRGIWRTGWCRFPMDETLAECAIDIAGRPHLVFEAAFTKDKVGEFHTDLTVEFFQAMAIALGCNLHLTLVRGQNDHHKVEALFKAFARALEMAVAVHPRAWAEIPSTKGHLDT